MRLRREHADEPATVVDERHSRRVVAEPVAIAVADRVHDPSEARRAAAECRLLWHAPLRLSWARGSLKLGHAAWKREEREQRRGRGMAWRRLVVRTVAWVRRAVRAHASP